MPDKPIAEMDHLLTYVRDLDAAASLFRRMGFTLSPISRIESMGISNHLVLMTPLTAGCGNYIELMASHNRSALPPPMVKTLSGGEGIKSMVLAGADIGRAQSAIAAAGFPVAAPFHVRREWVVGPGESVFPEFDVILPVDAPLVFNCCRYFNVELYLRPEWLKHENGARGLRAVFAVARDPEETLRGLGRVFGHAPEKDGDRVRTTPGQVDVVAMTPEAARERFGLSPADVETDGARYLGYLIEVESLDRLTGCLDRGGVPYRSLSESVAVDPATGLGNLIVFTAGKGA